MPVERTRSSGRGRAPRRGLSRILALLLACGTTFGGTTFGGIGEAAAFEIFGFKLWGSSDQEDADIVDPLRYSVAIEAPEADAELKKKLENSSTLKADEERPVSGSLGLLAKARGVREHWSRPLRGRYYEGVVETASRAGRWTTCRRKRVQGAAADPGHGPRWSRGACSHPRHIRHEGDPPASWGPTTG